LIEANRMALAAGYDVSETGSAGYAGARRGERTVVLFTGCRR
jgi:hypothetical protein